MTAFLVSGALPAKRQTFCPYVGVDPYVGIPATSVGGYRNALTAAGAVDDEINNNPDYWNWDGAGTLRFGCLFGGWARYVPYPDGYRVALHSCAFSTGLTLSGKATIDATDGTFALAASAPGGTNLTYARDADGHRTVTGTFLGKHVSLHH